MGSFHHRSLNVTGASVAISAGNTTSEMSNVYKWKAGFGPQRSRNAISNLSAV
jgi:hypothetical protein